MYCNKEISKRDLFLGFFWKFQLRLTEISQIWERCCSYKCYGLELEKQLRELQKEHGKQ